MEYAILAIILFALTDKKKDARPMEGPVYDAKAMTEGPEYKPAELGYEVGIPSQRAARQYIAEGEWDSDRGMA